MVAGRSAVARDGSSAGSHMSARGVSGRRRGRRWPPSASWSASASWTSGLDERSGLLWMCFFVLFVRVSSFGEWFSIDVNLPPNMHDCSLGSLLRWRILLVNKINSQGSARTKNETIEIILSSLAQQAICSWR